VNELPPTKTLRLQREGSVLHLWFARPEARNAMSFEMVSEIIACFEAIADDRTIRAVVLRGEGGHFCAGGDIKDMAAARGAQPGEDGADPMAKANRRFGDLVETIDAAPQAVVVVAEGAVMGGGFGLLCVSDVAIAVRGAKLRLPETSLGVPPAQIAPFVVRRIGITQARRFAVTGARLDADAALTVGLVHEVVNPEGIDEALAAVLDAIRKCSPNAIATTKRLMRESLTMSLGEVLDLGATLFAEAARGEGVEGMMAFIQKRPPAWAKEEGE
jgi:isohexenylglutaconyl-CoA hydratase